MKNLFSTGLDFYRKVSAKLGQYINTAYLRLLNVSLGERVKLIGRPVIQLHVGSAIEIGDDVVLCSKSVSTALGVSHPVVLRTLRAGAKLTIGNDTGISGGAICAAQSVHIGQRCLVGADVMIFDTDFHVIAPEGRRYNGNPDQIACKPVRIEDDVFIGTRSIILKGVHIGSGAIVAAGSVVTSDVAENAIVAGNPARQVRIIES